MTSIYISMRNEQARLIVDGSLQLFQQLVAAVNEQGRGTIELEEHGLLPAELQTAVEGIQHIPQLSIAIDNYTVVLVGENNMGDIIMISGNQDSIFNIKSDLNKVHQRVNRFSVTNSLVYELCSLKSELENELCQVSDGNEEEAEAVSEYARSLVEEATKAKPNKACIKISSDGLLAPAKNIATVAPVVLMIATRIVETIVKFQGD